MCNLGSHQRINFALVILIIRKTLVDLGAGESRKTGNDGIDACAGPRHRYHVMYPDACSFDDSVSGAHTRSFDNVTIVGCNHCCFTLSAARLRSKRAFGKMRDWGVEIVQRIAVPCCGDAR